MRILCTAILSVIAAGAAATTASSQAKMTTAKALELAFPGCKTERMTVTLDEGKQKAIGQRCGQRFKKSMVFPYVARRGDKVVGTAWFDVHKVRSKQQLLMIVVDENHRAARVEVLAFAEPKKYRAPQPWLRKLHGKQQGQLQPGRHVPRITGATLTVRATTRAVERVLAVHRSVFGKSVKTTTPPKPR